MPLKIQEISFLAEKLLFHGVMTPSSIVIEILQKGLLIIDYLNSCVPGGPKMIIAITQLKIALRCRDFREVRMVCGLGTAYKNVVETCNQNSPLF